MFRVIPQFYKKHRDIHIYPQTRKKESTYKTPKSFVFIKGKKALSLQKEPLHS